MMCVQLHLEKMWGEKPEGRWESCTLSVLPLSASSLHMAWGGP